MIKYNTDNIINIVRQILAEDEFSIYQLHVLLNETTLEVRLGGQHTDYKEAGWTAVEEQRNSSSLHLLDKSTCEGQDIHQVSQQIFGYKNPT